MKRHGNLWNKVIDMDNLRRAFTLAAAGKKNRDEVKVIADNLEYHLNKLRQMLIDGTFHTSKYTTRVIHEPKERIIYILPFYPDRIVHHAIMNVLEPIFERLFIYDSYSCRTNKGPHKGSTKCMKYVTKYRWCLKCDISKFYPTINHAVMKDILKHKFKDQKLLNLVFDIIDSIDGDVNLPIGNYISQWLGNLYLNQLDMFVKHTLHFKPYIRYCDDFCLFANSKQELIVVGAMIYKFVRGKLLQKFSKWDIFKTSRGVDFLGYRHFSNGKILVRKSTVKRLKVYAKESVYMLRHGLITCDQARSKIASVMGCICHANSHNLHEKLHIDQVRRFIDDYERGIESPSIF